MQDGYTYLARDGTRAVIYADPGIVVPDVLTLRTADGDIKTYDRASDRELTCEPVPGVTGQCGSYGCHRKQLGVCQCKRHPEGVPIRKAAATR